MDFDLTQLLASGSLEIVWWLAFFGAFGLCVGSFLNVVVYRVPRDISLSEPLWSFCPRCRSRIRWYDNLPVLSYFLLRGRCRDCGAAISRQYPTIELLGAFLALIVFDAFFIAHTHDGLGNSIPGLTWQLSEDWPIYLAHVVLFSSLLAMSMIDITYYWVDVRFTTFATVVGFLLHAIWTPAHAAEAWHRPSVPLSAGALVASMVWLATLIVLRFVYRDAYATASPPRPTPAPPSSVPGAKSHYDGLALRRYAGCPWPTYVQPDAAGVADPKRGRFGWGLLLLLVTGASVLYVVTGAVVEGAGYDVPGLGVDMRWAPGLVLLFVLIVWSGASHKQADHEIMEAIEAERPNARRMACQEFLWLLPTIVLGAGVIYLAATDSRFETWVTGLTSWEPVDGWMPVTGLGTAAAGFVIGAGIGWCVRLVATFIMGREAFGTGDIHMMGAAGCVAGWPVVLIGFVLCCVLAIAGWVLTLPFKRSRAIPLGPWLSVAFLIVVLFYDRIISMSLVQNVVYLFTSPVSFGNLTH